MLTIPKPAVVAIADAMKQYDDVARRIDAYITAQNWPVSREAGHMLPVYVEGANADLMSNADTIDMWNDMGGVLTWVDGVPRLLCWHVCTTEPGYAATHSNSAKALGGVARIQLGYHHEKWVMGFHKQNSHGKQHPALVQSGEILVHRDANKDGKRTGDLIRRAYGINQHSTRPYYDGHNVGNWSAGCLVRRNWTDHEFFIWLLKQDSRYAADQRTKFSTVVLDGSKIPA